MADAPDLADGAVDVLVVGAGIAGAAAMLEAHAAGATVRGVDRLPAFGGTTATSGGGSFAAGTPFQEAHGIDDDPAAALEDILAAGDGAADEDWARFYVEHAVRDVYGWQVALGVEFVQVRAQEHSRVPRWHGPRGNGRGLMDAVWRRMQDERLDTAWRFATDVEALLRDRDRVAGVTVRGRDGTRHDLMARTVVMATGGFAGSHDQVLRHRPDLHGVERLLVGGGAGATGTGHDLLAHEGAALDAMDRVWCYPALPDYRDPSGRRGLVVRGLEGGFWVNAQGRRFHDESLPGPGHAMPALLAQRPPTCWSILDRSKLLRIRIADPHFRTASGRPSERIDELVAASPFVHEGADPADLARRAGIEAAGLEATIAAWNGLVASGATHDPATRRPLAGLEPVAGPPWYAIQLFPLARKNLGGVRTDLRCRVLRPDGTAIPGLYAAGELCGFAGGHLAGRRAIEGIMIGASLFSGRVAGAWAAHEVGGPEPAHLDAARTLLQGARALRGPEAMQ